MSIAKKLMTTGAEKDTYVDDVFSTYVYTGNGADRDIENGVDLAGEGGLVWLKNRSFGLGHALFDTERGAKVQLQSDNTGEQWTYNNSLTSFNSDGFSLGNGEPNRSGDDHVSWTFRKQPGFFDVVTFDATGAGTSLTIPHNLGSVPAMIIIKSVSQAGNWEVYHKNVGPGTALYLNYADASSSNAGFFPTAPDENVFHIGAPQRQAQMVAYLFAHDDSDESLIKCGIASYNGSNPVDVDLGFEPQCVLYKAATQVDDWYMIDSVRGWASSFGNEKSQLLYPNKASEEYGASYNCSLNSNGFTIGGAPTGRQYIYMAIRRPNKPAKEFEPEELFAVDNGDGTIPGFVSGFPVDGAIRRFNVTTSDNHELSSRLTSGNNLFTNSTLAESVSGTTVFDYMNGYRSDAGATNDYAWMWRRAPGFFDVVTYTGSSSAVQAVHHNLGVAPEMMWLKNRDSSASWPVYYPTDNNQGYMYLDTNAKSAYWSYAWGFNPPNETQFEVNRDIGTNATNGRYIAYLFASAPGISKVGSYTGTGQDLIVDCGFSTGARFVLIKRTDMNGDWHFWDTERGINVGNEPYLRLNEAYAQANSNFIDPHASGFIAKAATSDVNAGGGKYLFYAIA